MNPTDGGIQLRVPLILNFTGENFMDQETMLKYHDAIRDGIVVQLEHTDYYLRCHSPSRCAGEPCTMHNRTDHHMRHMPQRWRGDVGKMERVCEHGVGHPDPDCYYTSRYNDKVHGCDGCCNETTPVP